MKIGSIIKKLEDNEEFKTWHKESYASSIVHVFKMFDEANKDEFQLGYFNSDETITTWIVGKDDIKMVPKEEVFKKPDSKIKKLDMELIGIDFSQAREKAVNLQEEKYPNEKPMKEIAILQNLEVGQVFNFTFVTQSFKTLNIKIDSKTGEVMSDELMNLMDLGKQ